MDNAEAIRLRDRYIEALHQAEVAFEEWNAYMGRFGLRATRKSCSDDEMDTFPPVSADPAPPCSSKPPAEAKMAAFFADEAPRKPARAARPPAKRPRAKPAAAPAEPPAEPAAAEPLAAAPVSAPAEVPAEAPAQPAAEQDELLAAAQAALQSMQIAPPERVEVMREFKRRTNKRTGEVHYAFKVTYRVGDQTVVEYEPAEAPEEPERAALR